MKAQIFNASTLTAQDIKIISQKMQNGAVVVFPTDTVYGIGTGALCEQAIERIYQIKQRPATQPLQILAGSLQQAQVLAIFSKSAENLARTFWGGALTLILPPSPQGKPLARGARGIGLRVPDYPLLDALLTSPIASTSANLHEQPVLTDEVELENTFAQKVDIIIKAGKLSPLASSVVDLTDNQKPVLLREGVISRAQLETVLEYPFV